MKKRTRVLIAVAGVVVVGAVAAVVAVTAVRKAQGAHRRHGGKVTEIAVGEVAPLPSFWIDLRAPKPVWKALQGNAWIERVRADPLGQGLSAGWAAFFGTKGADLQGAFEGTIIDAFREKLLTDPLRMIFFAGGDATGAPALFIPHPSSAAKRAFEVLDAAATHDLYEAARCPGPFTKAEQEEKERSQKASEQGQVPAPVRDPSKVIQVSRWVLADQSLFVGERGGHLALGMR